MGCWGPRSSHWNCRMWPSEYCIETVSTMINIVVPHVCPASSNGIQMCTYAYIDCTYFQKKNMLDAKMHRQPYDIQHASVTVHDLRIWHIPAIHDRLPLGRYRTHQTLQLYIAPRFSQQKSLGKLRQNLIQGQKFHLEIFGGFRMCAVIARVCFKMLRLTGIFTYMNFWMVESFFCKTDCNYGWVDLS